MTHAAWNGGLPASSWKTIQPSAQRSELRREGGRERERERERGREGEREREKTRVHSSYISFSNVVWVVYFGKTLFQK